MPENFPNLVKETNFQVQKDEPKQTHTKTHHN